MSDDHMGTHQVSRRHFLRLSAGAGVTTAAVALLQACAPAAAPSPTAKPAAPAPTAAPAATTAPAATAAPAAKQAAPAAKTLLKVRFLNTQGGLGDWGSYVAQEKGYFQEEGLEVEVTPVGSQPAITNSVMSGQADVATTSIPTAFSAALSNAPMKLVLATQMATPQGKYNNWWCVLPDSPIQKAADIKGKKVHIFAQNSLAQAVTRTVLDKSGLKGGTDFEEVGFTFDQAYTSLKGGRVDVALFIEPFFTNSNKLAAQEYGGRPLRVIYTMLDAFPKGIHLAAMVGNTNWTAQNQEAMRRLARAYLKAAKWGNANQAEVNQIIAKYAQVPPENIKDMIPAEHSEDGKFIPGFLRELQEILIKNGTIQGLTTPFPDEKVLETSHLPSA